jgi:hypothetical protein
MNETEKLKDLFIKYLTEDSPHNDRRRKDYNQAIFDKNEGWLIWNTCDLDMIMEKFDKAVKELRNKL